MKPTDVGQNSLILPSCGYFRQQQFLLGGRLYCSRVCKFFFFKNVFICASLFFAMASFRNFFFFFVLFLIMAIWLFFRFFFRSYDHLFLSFFLYHIYSNVLFFDRKKWTCMEILTEKNAWRNNYWSNNWFWKQLIQYIQTKTWI